MANDGGKRIPRSSLEETRTRVIRAIENGVKPDQAAIAFECGRSTVFGWWRAYRDSGAESLRVKKAPGAPGKLTERQVDQLRAWIVGRDPRQLEFEFALWTRAIVADLIRREFGVDFTLQGVGKLLRRIGLSPQRPLVRAYEQNPEMVRWWKEEEYPRIHAKAVAAGASIFFEDEANVRADHHAGTTWAPVGRTPIVRGSGKRFSLKMISAVSARGKLHFSCFEGNLNSAAFVDYLKKLLADIPGKIYLVVDNAPTHKSAETRKYVDSTDGRLTLFLLPPYSPELNPDEWVWKNVKHDHAKRAAARTDDELRNTVENAISRLQRIPDLVKAFFHDPDLSYIMATLPKSSS